MMNLNLKSPSRVVPNQPISVESTPRSTESFISVAVSELVMPDLVTLEGSGGGGGGGSGTVTPRIQQQNSQDFEGTERDRSSGHLNHVAKTVRVVDRFNEVYQDRIRNIEQSYGAEEGTRLKEDVYKRWVSDFAEHNRALLTAIADLEYETEQRLAVMEDQLREAHRQRDGDFQMQRIHRLENDLRTLARLIRRAQTEGVWRAEGLELQDPQFNDVLDVPSPEMNVKLCIRTGNNECEEKTELNVRRPGFVPLQLNAETDLDEEEEKASWMAWCERLKRENHDLNKQLLDNRVLALEVAEKHDQILRLRSEVNQLEENLRQANMQTHFKDDVIKELRRECRNLMSPHLIEAKRSVSVCMMPKSNELEVPKTQAEQRREKKTEEHNSFLEDLGIVLEILGHSDPPSNDSLEKRILNSLKELKDKFLAAQEERDVLKNNNSEMESKFGELIKEKMDLHLVSQKSRHELLRKIDSQKTHLLRLKQTMVASGGMQFAGVPQEEEDEEDFLGSETNRILFDANQMLIDLKNEIDRKNGLITSNSQMVEGLKEEVAKKTEELEELKKDHKRELFDKDKLIIDLENSIRNHNNRIEDLEVEKLQLETEVIELKRSVLENPMSEQLQSVTTHRNQLEIECANQKTTISNLKDALENLKRESVSQSNAANHSHHHRHKNVWNWLKNMHDV